ncbi:hypothetical protein NFJ02_18g30260 [Pycnococcus provasolii]
MGITKLLPELSEFTSTDVDLSVVLKAKRVVVDASVWLHQRPQQHQPRGGKAGVGGGGIIGASPWLTARRQPAKR